ncbi:hypothetical protein [Streptomyces sp. T21Q-yed]|uniref:hypothetical protein n=1 Tax=Streptomyces sp. T21Q-yed TaxID=3018441 RepID=UPI0023DFAB61|nr:hypothetical protein [Streptomyces sp. T21Q-yed]MDF3140477.1 hypothetical protein [Streptomyces sp. T21Q-yed]
MPFHVLQRQLANQRGELHIVGALAGIHPQNAGDCRSHAGPAPVDKEGGHAERAAEVLAVG